MTGAPATDVQDDGAFRRFRLDAWRAATGWDVNSVVVDKSRFDVLPYRMLMRANLPETWTTLASLHLVDDRFQDALPIWKAELNTPDGYRGKTLGETTAFRDVVACPAGFHLLLRFQVVAPGPAPAGIGTLDIRRFDIVRE